MNSVLIIEDDELIRRNMSSILEMEGFDVRSACDGAAGIEMVRQRRPDLILCDIVMPEMDGHTVLELLKRETALVDIPFMFVTGQANRADIRRGMSSGADDYLTKPFTGEELVAAVTGRLRRIETLRIHAEKSVFLDEHAYLRQQITPRELEILLLVGQGLTSKQIAERLGIRHKTVQAHRANLMVKLDSPNSATLARWAVIAEQMSPFI